MTRVRDFLAEAADDAADKIALVCGAERLTYRALAARAHDVASSLRRAGVVPGDRVLVVADHSVGSAAAIWGVLDAGAVLVPLHPTVKPDKLAWLQDHCGAAAIIREGRVEPVTPVARTEADAEAARELAAIIYTSGSTGRPKGVMLTQMNIVSAADSIAQYLDLVQDDVIQVLSPLSFDYGLYQLFLSARRRARVVLAPPFTLPAQVLKQAAAERVTFFPGVPTHFALLGRLQDVSRWDLTSVRAVTSTAAVLMPSHVATIRGIFPAAQIFSMYGLTECKRCSYLPPADLDRKPGSVGIPIPRTEFWIVDDEERRLALGGVGQLVIRGSHVMRGYWRDPVATAERLRPGPTGEPVLYTGDVCRLDEEGYLYFVGRTDDILKCRGEKVAPKEVELALHEIPGVIEAAVVGVDDELLGQAVTAFVVVENATLTERELVRECGKRLESFKVPARVLVLPSLPKNPHGKIDRPRLLALL
jgi:amino acid adenylation domain-containing protein